MPTVERVLYIYSQAWCSLLAAGCVLLARENFIP